MTVPPRRFFVETWGCQMNELDSQRMSGQLMQLGMLPARAVEDADLVLLNSCSVRERAEQKVYSRLGEYRLLKRERPALLLGLCGCVAQQEGERALAFDLYEYLHDQGVDFWIESVSASGRATDRLHVHARQRAELAARELPP